jgi:hypothetical protein
MRRISTVLVSLAVLATPIQASGRPLEAHHPTAAPHPAVVEHRSAIQEQYLKLYWQVVRAQGRRAPGRNIVTRGIVTHGHTREAHRAELKDSIGRLAGSLAPPPAPVASVSQTSSSSTSAPSSTSGGGYTIPASIVMCESGGNPQAVNRTNPNRPAGLYQIITSTWLAHGGGAYAPTADQASPADQGTVASSIYAGGAGRGQWEC